MFDYNQPLVIFLLNYNPLSPSILNNCTTSTSMLWEKKKGIDVLKRWSYKFYEVCIREKGGRLRNIQTTGRWNHSALASRRDFIYWSGFYVLIFLPSLLICKCFRISISIPCAFVLSLMFYISNLLSTFCRVIFKRKNIKLKWNIYLFNTKF